MNHPSRYGVIDARAASVGSRRLSRSKTKPTEQSASRIIAARRAAYDRAQLLAPLGYKVDRSIPVGSSMTGTECDFIVTAPGRAEVKP